MYIKKSSQNILIPLFFLLFSVSPISKDCFYKLFQHTFYGYGPGYVSFAHSLLYCFKLLKDGNLLSEALVQNCSDLPHILDESRINRVSFRNRTVNTQHPFQT